MHFEDKAAGVDEDTKGKNQEDCSNSTEITLLKVFCQRQSFFWRSIFSALEYYLYLWERHSAFETALDTLLVITWGISNRRHLTQGFGFPVIKELGSQTEDEQATQRLATASRLSSLQLSRDAIAEVVQLDYRSQIQPARARTVM